jgi:hypothetical protein
VVAPVMPPIDAVVAPAAEVEPPDGAVPHAITALAQCDRAAVQIAAACVRGGRF